MRNLKWALDLFRAPEWCWMERLLLQPSTGLKFSNCANLFSSVRGGISAEQEWWAKLSQAQFRLGYSVFKVSWVYSQFVAACWAGIGILIDKYYTTCQWQNCKSGTGNNLQFAETWWLLIDSIVLWILCWRFWQFSFSDGSTNTHRSYTLT